MRSPTKDSQTMAAQIQFRENLRNRIEVIKIKQNCLATIDFSHLHFGKFWSTTLADRINVSCGGKKIHMAETEIKPDHKKQHLQPKLNNDLDISTK